MHAGAFGRSAIIQSNQRVCSFLQQMQAIAGLVHWRLSDPSDTPGGNRGQRDNLRRRQVREARRVALLFRGAETHARSVLKAVSWRTLGTLDTFAISWFMTGRVEIAGSIAGLEIITKLAWYYLHERVWAAIPWGRR
jgi:uncharacterized membrane protein